MEPPIPVTPPPAELEEFFRAPLMALMHASEEIVISKTLDGIVRSWNLGAEQRFGYKAHEMIGQSIRRLIPPDLQAEEEDFLARLHRGEIIERYETIRIDRQGRRFEVSLSLSPIRDRNGHIIGAVKVGHDISMRRRMEAELQEMLTERERLLESERAARSEAERLSHIKDEFLATLSHELRTPLNAIQGWATVLRQGKVSEADRAKGLETIERNVRVQAQLVNDLLDMSRIVVGKIHLEVQALYLHEVIEAAIQSIQPSADAKQIRIRTLLDTRIGKVRGDPNRLQQVLWNLLSNAVKFTPTGGFVQVVLERVNSHVEIMVEDSGVGIPPEFLPYVFDRFRQAAPSMTRRHGGLGLGLSIVKSLVELHGGSVRVKSPGENQGATFVISLPISMVPTQDEPTAAQHPSSQTSCDPLELPSLDGIKILIVDDDADSLALAARILEGHNAETVPIRSAVEALNLLRNQSFDIVLSDIGMPDLDGYSFIRKVRELDGARRTPIPAIAITAFARAEDRQRSLLAGFQMHISKPIEAAELIAGIASLLRLSR